jgi:hypothetical protein
VDASVSKTCVLLSTFPESTGHKMKSKPFEISILGDSVV